MKVMKTTLIMIVPDSTTQEEALEAIDEIIGDVDRDIALKDYDYNYSRIEFSEIPYPDPILTPDDDADEGYEGWNKWHEEVTLRLDELLKPQ